MIENDGEILSIRMDPLIVDLELNAPASDGSIEAGPANCARRGALHPVAVFSLFLALTLTLQWLSGAYHAEFAGYPDESAHYVTSLMVREYITSLHFSSPVQFARDYYAHYPKVAFGHWPPVLYVVQALWMSLFSASRASVLGELAFTTALLAFAVYGQARRWLVDFSPLFRSLAGVALGLLVVSIPLVQRHTDEEMAETLLTLFCFWSVIYFVRYLESERWGANCLFGLFFALAVLTKGSGWLLTLVPPVALLLTRRFGLLFRPSFWAAPLLVAVTCIPWQLMTMHLVEQGWEGGSRPTIAYTLAALAGFAPVLAQILGPALLILLIIGVVTLVIAPAVRGPVASGPAVMFALIFSDWLFHSLVPAGVEDRKLIIAIPAALLFVLAGTVWLGRRVPGPYSSLEWRVACVALLGVGLFSTLTFSIPRERHYGFIEAARYIAASPKFRGATMLVSSCSGGEGPFVAEVAMTEPQPKATILRATKALAYVSFDADVYRANFSDAASILRFLRQRGVSLLVLDSFPASAPFPHDRLLHQLVRQPGLFQQVATFPSNAPPSAGRVELYQLQTAQ